MAYIKTEWENEPSESTPINAENLNKIEDGIYNNSQNIGDITALNTTDKSNVVNAINELIGVELYSNSNGATENITLTDAIENYKQFEIVFSRGGNGYHTNRFTTDYLTNMTLITSFFGSDILRVYVANISIAGRTLTRNYTKALNFTGTNQLNFGDENNVLIYKVIGYK